MGARFGYLTYPTWVGQNLEELVSMSRFTVTYLKYCRAHINPLHSRPLLDPTISGQCWNGCGELGTRMHSLCYCPSIMARWDKVRDRLRSLEHQCSFMSSYILVGYLAQWPINCKSAQNIVSVPCNNNNIYAVWNRKSERPVVLAK